MVTHGIPDTHRLDVLVVNNDPDSRRMIRDVLEQLGHGCRLAADGSEALEMHATSPADVFLSERQMPDMHCEELCERLRAADGPAAHTYFIFLTTPEEHAMVPRGMKAGADDYQQKPIDVPALEGRLISAARALALHRKVSVAADPVLDTLTAASLAVALQQRMSEEVGQIFAAAKRYKRHCCVAICAIEHPVELSAGDRATALDAAAGAARESLRESDALFRLTASEFLIVLPEQTLQDSMVAIHRVRDRVALLDLTLNIGVSQIEPFDTTAHSWVNRTERALTHARSIGGIVAINA